MGNVLSMFAPLYNGMFVSLLIEKKGKTFDSIIDLTRKLFGLNKIAYKDYLDNFVNILTVIEKN